MTFLYLENNQISDISPLSGLRYAGELNLRGNPLNVCAYCFYLPLIEAKNPLAQVLYDPNPYPPEACDLHPCCGDGIIQWREGETCEPPDSHIFGSWYCDAMCQAYYEPPYCGDDIIQWREGEQCEIPPLDRCGPRAECIECVCVSTAYCGDGIVQWRRGEQCELEVGNECGPLGECIECQCVKVE
jgi:hypothetical protein